MKSRRRVVPTIIAALAGASAVAALVSGVPAHSASVPPATVRSLPAAVPLPRYSIVPLPNSSLSQRGVISYDGHYMVVGTPGGGWYEYADVGGTPTLLGRLGTSDYLNSVSNNGNAAGGTELIGHPPTALFFPLVPRQKGVFPYSPPRAATQIKDPAFNPPETIDWSFDPYNAHINSSDLVVGTSNCPPPANPTDGSNGPCGTPNDYNSNGTAAVYKSFRAYQWQAGATTISPEPFGNKPVHDGYEVSALNNRGDFAGRYEPLGAPNLYFVETVGGTISQGPLSFSGPPATPPAITPALTIQAIEAMNASMTLVGVAGVDGTQSIEPWFSNGAGGAKLLSLPAPETDESGNPVIYDQGAAEAVNDAGIAVGYANSSTTSSTLFTDTAMLWTADGTTTVDINTLLSDPSTYRITEAWGIDGRGDIIASIRNITDGTSTMAELRPGISISVADAKVNRPTVGNTAQMNFTVSLSGVTSVPVTVDYSTTDVTALQPTDYTFTSGSLTFAPGDTSKIVPVTIQGGPPDNRERSLLLGLANPTGAVLASPASGIGTIVNGPAVTNVVLSIGHDTPLWNIDLTASLAHVTCPSTLSISVGPLSTQESICEAGGLAPPSVKTTLRVYGRPVDGDVALVPGASAPIVATVTGPDPSSGPYHGNVTTPPAPVWIGVGDSFSSGHHQDQDLPSCFDETTCGVHDNDPSFSWVTAAAAGLNTTLSVPPAWAMQPVVVARSGQAAADFTQPDAPNGPAGQLTQLTQALAAHPATWNVVSLEAGGNDAGLSEALQGFYTRQLPSEAVLPWGVSNQSDCVSGESFWSVATTPASATAITAALQRVVTAADAGGPPVRVVELQYPHILPDSNVCAGDAGGTHGTTSAVDALDRDMSLVTSVDALVDLRPVFGANPIPAMQTTRLFGFPHPNACGQSLIAKAAVAAVVGNPAPVNDCVSQPTGSAPACGGLQNCQGATNTDPHGSATATSSTPSGSVTASGAGIGGITVGRYGANPVGGTLFSSAGAFFDVKVSTPNGFTSVSIRDCDLAAATSIQWWDPTARSGAGAWKPVSVERYAAGPPACITITADANSSPSIADLTGTVFVGASDTTPTPTATSTTTSTPTTTNTPTSTPEKPTDTPVPTSTNTPEVSQTPQATTTIELTQTVEVTKTALSTNTPEVSVTPEGSATPKTETPTNTPVPSTSTPTNTSAPTSTTPAPPALTPAPPTMTPVPTVTVVLTFNTPTSTTVVNTSTPPAASTRLASTSTAVNSVIGNQTGPRGGAAGTVALPRTGQAESGDKGEYLFAILAFAIGGLGLISAATYGKRQR